MNASRILSKIGLARTALLMASFSCGAAMLAAPAFAQDRGLEWAQTAIELTDRRIEQARTLTAKAPAEARSELGEATRLQALAKDALAANRYRFAIRCTLEARRRADRAIAMTKGLPDPDRARNQVERTREMLQKTEDRLQECGVARARDLVREASELQRRAEDGERAGHYLVALQLTTAARERIQRARRLCMFQEDLQESAQRALQRTDEVIVRAQQAAESSRSSNARRVLARAVELETRAQQDYRSGFYEPCLRQTQSARAFAYRAARLAGVDPGAR